MFLKSWKFGLYKKLLKKSSSSKRVVYLKFNKGKPTSAPLHVVYGSLQVGPKFLCTFSIWTWSSIHMISLTSWEKLELLIWNVAP